MKISAHFASTSSKGPIIKAGDRMARPPKEGLGYFPMDVDIDQDDKLIVPIAKHGMTGFGVIVKLMMEIYRNGYFYPWTEKEMYVFPFKIGTDKELVNEIVTDCIESGFFHKEQFEKNHILTSYGFQKRFLLAANRRKDAVINDLYRVKKEFLHTETELSHAETQKMSAESTQKKVNKKKVKETNIYVEIIGYLNQKTGKKYSPKSAAKQKLINGRIEEGRTVDDFKTVIDTKYSHWHDNPKMSEYLRPDTLFRVSNFDRYLNEKPIQAQVSNPIIDSRDKEIEFQQWLQEGNDPNDFDWS